MLFRSAQCIGVLANIVFVGIMGFIVFKAIDIVIGLRVSAEAEAAGLDIPEMGVPGYVGVTDSLALPELTATHEVAAKTFSTQPR